MAFQRSRVVSVVRIRTAGMSGFPGRYQTRFTAKPILSDLVSAGGSARASVTGRRRVAPKNRARDCTTPRPTGPRLFPADTRRPQENDMRYGGSAGGTMWHRVCVAGLLAVASLLAGCEAAATPPKPVSSAGRVNPTGSATPIPKPSFDAPVVASTTGFSRAVTVSTGGDPNHGQRTFPTAPPPTPTGPTGVPRDWVPTAKPNAWYWIIIHHTATPSGALSRINASHRGKGWDGAGYHFVIGNGTESADGQVEVGPRWPTQTHGAHTRSSDNRFNEHGIGIVMIGNFNETKPSRKQLESTARLVAYLMKTYKVPPERVIGHRDASATQCPGRNTSIAQIRQMATQILANAGEAIPQSRTRLAGTPNELLKDVR